MFQIFISFTLRLRQNNILNKFNKRRLSSALNYFIFLNELRNVKHILEIYVYTIVLISGNSNQFVMVNISE